KAISPRRCYTHALLSESILAGNLACLQRSWSDRRRILDSSERHRRAHQIGRRSRPGGAIRMRYYLNLFSPETWRAFKGHGATVSGFSIHQKGTAERIRSEGDLAPEVLYACVTI